MLDVFKIGGLAVGGIMVKAMDYHPTLDDFYVTPRAAQPIRERGRTQRDKKSGKKARYLARKNDKANYNREHN